jgi:hypothetical protein
MVHNLVGFNLNGVRLGSSENAVDHIRPDCPNIAFFTFALEFHLLGSTGFDMMSPITITVSPIFFELQLQLYGLRLMRRRRDRRAFEIKILFLGHNHKNLFVFSNRYTYIHLDLLIHHTSILYSEK